MNRKARQAFIRTLERGMQQLGAAVHTDRAGREEFVVPTRLGPYVCRVRPPARVTEGMIAAGRGDFLMLLGHFRYPAQACFENRCGPSGKRNFSLSGGRITVRRAVEAAESIVDWLRRLKPLPETNDWQPMHTAPKDRDILVLEHQGVAHVRWKNGTWAAVGRVWFIEHPRCWMPLPKLPDPGAFEA